MRRRSHTLRAGATRRHRPRDGRGRHQGLARRSRKGFSSNCRVLIVFMDLKLPPLGEGVDSGSVVSILVKEGDQIAKGQGIIELETGKAVAPVPASTAGKVTKIHVSVGDKIAVGQTLISLEGGAAAAPVKAAAPKAAASRPARPAPPPVEEGGAEEP